jgi:hypothetical protein
MKAETLRRYFGDMPPLDHYPLRDADCEFRWEDSEVVDYIMSHPGFMANLFSQITKSGAIRFNPDTKTWRGYRYQDEPKISSVKTQCQNSISSHQCQCQNPILPLGEGGVLGYCDTGHTPNPKMTLAVNIDTDANDDESEVRR